MTTKLTNADGETLYDHIWSALFGNFAGDEWESIAKVATQAAEDFYASLAPAPDAEDAAAQATLTATTGEAFDATAPLDADERAFLKDAAFTAAKERYGYDLAAAAFPPAGWEAIAVAVYNAAIPNYVRRIAELEAVELGLVKPTLVVTDELVRQCAEVYIQVLTGLDPSVHEIRHTEEAMREVLKIAAAVWGGEESHA
jgi:hypothetical protein